jgi:hypothetical protein
MENKFGDAHWDIYSNHKGNWCLYRSMVCQEGVCSGCQIHLEAEEKWRILMTESFKELAK